MNDHSDPMWWCSNANGLRRQIEYCILILTSVKTQGNQIRRVQSAVRLPSAGVGLH